MATLRRKIKIHLKDTDAAGILYFGNQFDFAHVIYEEFLERIGFPMGKLITEASFFIPIVHAEAEYLQSVGVGDELEISLCVEKIGNTSYTLCHELVDQRGELVGKVRTVHVTIDRLSRSKIALPAEFRAALLKFQSDP